MEMVLRIVVGALVWYLIGFLTICVSNLFDGLKSHEEWVKFRKWLYWIGLSGPIITIVIIIYLLVKLIKMIWKLCHANSLFAFVAKISDWMIAGFRKPPAPPVTENDEAPDFPTASP